MDRWELDSAMYDLIARYEYGELDEEDRIFLINLRHDLMQMDLGDPNDN